MIRTIIILIFVFSVYYALKTVLRSAVKAYHERDQQHLLKGEEMVLDPECRTYIVRDRAVVKRIHGKLTYFCSESCAQKHQKQA